MLFRVFLFPLIVFFANAGAGRLSTALGSGIPSQEGSKARLAAWSDFRDGNLTKAAQTYLSIASKFPDDPRPLLNAAIVLKDLGRTGEAVSCMEKASALLPEDPDVWTELGWMRFHSAVFRGAKEAFVKALKIRPLHDRALEGLGLVCAQMNRKKEAFKALSRCQKLKPGFAGLDYLLAGTYMNFKMYDEAAQRLEGALKKDFTFVEARLPLAGIYLKQKKIEKAWKQYSRVLDVYSRHPLALKMEKKLRPMLAKKPEKIRPARKITRPLGASKVPGIKKSPVIRVGIGTYGGGKQPDRSSLSFRCGGPFKIIGKKSGRIYASGKADETWTADWKSGRIYITSPDATVYGRFKGEVLIKPDPQGAGGLILERLKYARGQPWTGIADREYRGAIALFPARHGIRIVNEVEMEEYLLGVVPCEVPEYWPLEALKVQAVIARTQSIIRKSRGGTHKRLGYHLCDCQHCQVYKGIHSEKSRTQKAVIQTQGEILTYRGKPAHTFYFSNCGGHTQSSWEVTGWGKLPYLKGRPDAPPGKISRNDSPWRLHLWLTSAPPAYCNYPGVVPYSEFRWLRVVSHKDMEYKINRKYGIGKLKAIIPLCRSLAGNVNSIMFRGSRRRVIVRKEHLIRGILGVGQARSTLFVIETHRDVRGKPESYWIHGGGWGHGVGLCQSGAAGMAGRDGKDYSEILRFYYPGTEIEKIALQ